ncbi:hypothetical protein N8703_02845 [Verrucomicrobia bacterium]|nr:hypothetical protein [Verrucomicrobiota bacterium]
MPDFEWTDELTEFAHRNCQHATWAASNPGDMLRVVKYFQENGGSIGKEEKDTIRDGLGVGGHDVFHFLRHLRHLTEDTLELTKGHEDGDRPGFYTGQTLGRVLEDLGLEQAKKILGHNFMLHAREGLSFCSRLCDPGVPKDFLKETMLDHYVFNQKLNSFKFDNLIRNLMGFRVIKEGDCGLIIDRAPPVLTFYQITSSYFFLSGGKVNCRVDAKDLLRQVDSVIPRRDEDYSVLGFKQFPIEGWGKHQAKMTPESFSKLLEIGLVETKTIALILSEIARNEANPSRDVAKNAANRIKDALLKQLKKFKPEPIGYEEVVSLLDQVNNP